MISAMGIPEIDSILKELKKSEMEDAQVHQEKANGFFDQKISTLRAQAKDLEAKAAKIGGMGIFNFVFSIITSIIQAIVPVFNSTLKNATLKWLNPLLQGVQNFMGTFQQLFNKMHEQDLAQIDASQKNKEVLADTYEKLFTESKNQEQQAQKRGNEVLQTLKDVKRDLNLAHESLIKI